MHAFPRAFSQLSNLLLHASTARITVTKITFNNYITRIWLVIFSLQIRRHATRSFTSQNRRESRTSGISTSVSFLVKLESVSRYYDGVTSKRPRPKETHRRLPSSGTVGGSTRASVGPQSHLHLGILAVRQVGLDAGRGGTRGARAAHVPAVVAVMMMVVAGRVVRVVVIVMIEVWWLRGRSRTPVGPLLLLEVAQPLVVALELIAQQRVLLGGVFLVVLEAADAVQPFQVDPTPPPHAHAVHDQMRA